MIMYPIIEDRSKQFVVICASLYIYSAQTKCTYHKSLVKPVAWRQMAAPTGQFDNIVSFNCAERWILVNMIFRLLRF